MKRSLVALVVGFTLTACNEKTSLLSQDQEQDIPFPTRAKDVDVSACTRVEEEKCNKDQLRELDADLEDAYWGYTERQEFQKLTKWVEKTYNYVQITNTPGKGRLSLLSGFARMNVARSGDMFSVNGLGDLANGINLGRGAEKIMNEDTEDQDALAARERSMVSARIFNLVGEGVLGFATEKNEDGKDLVGELLGSLVGSLAKPEEWPSLLETIKQLASALLPSGGNQASPDTEASSKGMASVRDLNDLQEEFSSQGQRHFAREGAAVAAMLQTYAADKETVKAGVAILEDQDNGDLMTLTNGSSPTKSVGMHMAVAEGLVYLGEMERAKQHLNKAKAAAAYLPTVLQKKLSNISKKLLDETESGYNQLWKTTKPIGNLRMPLAPSMGADGCSLCHNGAFANPQ